MITAWHVIAVKSGKKLGINFSRHVTDEFSSLMLSCLSMNKGDIKFRSVEGSSGYVSVSKSKQGSVNEISDEIYQNGI